MDVGYKKWYHSKSWPKIQKALLVQYTPWSILHRFGTVQSANDRWIDTVYVTMSFSPKRVY